MMISASRGLATAAPRVKTRVPALAVVNKVPPGAESTEFDPYEGLYGKDRERSIVGLIGVPEQKHDVQGFVKALRNETAHYWDLFVEPLIDKHWPEVRQTPFYSKFKVGAQQVYAPAPYTVVVLSKRRPWVVSLLTAICSLFRLPRVVIVWGLKCFLPFYTRLFLQKENRRIVLMAAFIAAADEAFDHHLQHIPPEHRGDLLRKILNGDVEPPTKSFALVRAIRVALDENTTEEESKELANAMEGCARWGEAEMRRLMGLHDEEGLCHRGEGIRNGINGLAWTVRKYISKSEWNWMYDVSYFIQMMDDWVDLEKDLKEGVVTPVAQGVWNLNTVSQWFQRTNVRVAEIAEENGADDEAYLELIADGYAFQVRDLLQNMVKGIAD